MIRTIFFRHNRVLQWKKAKTLFWSFSAIFGLFGLFWPFWPLKHSLDLGITAKVEESHILHGKNDVTLEERDIFSLVKLVYPTLVKLAYPAMKSRAF